MDFPSRLHHPFTHLFPLLIRSPEPPHLHPILESAFTTCTSSLPLFRRFWDCYLMCSMSWLSVAFSSFLLFLRDLYLPAWPVCLNFGLFIGPCLLLSGGFFVPAAGLTSAFDLYLACFTILKAFLPHFVEEITEVLLPCWHKPQQHLFFCLFVVCF